MVMQGITGAYGGNGLVHGLFVGLGVLAAAVVVVLEARRRAMWGDGMLVSVTGALAGGAIGMRLSGLLRDPAATVAQGVWQTWQDGAKSVVGGLAGAYVGVLIAKRLIGYRVKTGDVFAPAVALGMAIGRFGCLLTEPPGRPTSLPWGVHLSAAQAASIPSCGACQLGVALHPSFAYEIAFQAMAFVALLWLRGRVHQPGALLTIYLGAYAMFRFCIEFVRDNEVLALGLTRVQLFIAVLAPLMCWRLWVLAKEHRGSLSRSASVLASSGTGATL